MRLLAKFMVAACVLAAASSAGAFEEERAGGAASTTAPGVSVETPKSGFGSTTGDLKQSEEGGTVVRIPGLGKLGVIPKLDFGLELLYGASKPPVEVAPPSVKSETDDDGLRIRGSVKHRF